MERRRSKQEFPYELLMENTSEGYRFVAVSSFALDRSQCGAFSISFPTKFEAAEVQFLSDHKILFNIDSKGNSIQD